MGHLCGACEAEAEDPGIEYGGHTCRKERSTVSEYERGRKDMAEDLLKMAVTVRSRKEPTVYYESDLVGGVISMEKMRELVADLIRRIELMR